MLIVLLLLSIANFLAPPNWIGKLLLLLDTAAIVWFAILGLRSPHPDELGGGEAALNWYFLGGCWLLLSSIDLARQCFWDSHHKPIPE
jgi:hypothetical protein